MKLFINTIMIAGLLCIGSEVFSQNCTTLFNDKKNTLPARKVVNSKFLIDENTNRRFVGSLKYPATTEILGNDVVVYNEGSKTTVQIRTPLGQSKIFEILDQQAASSSGSEITLINRDGIKLTITHVLTTPKGSSLLLVTISDLNSLSALVLAE